MGITETVRRVSRFTNAFTRWYAAGSPTRTPEQIAETFAICESNQCGQFKAGKEGAGRCGLCGCRLNLTGKVNKIYMATESCPYDPPLWTALVESGNGQAEPEQKVRPTHYHTEDGIVLVEQELGQEQKPMSRAEARAKRIREREERIARRKAAEALLPPAYQPPDNKDPLVITDRFGQEIGHVLRDMWAPNAGFLVCGGPSTKELDLSPLRERGIVSLGINNVCGKVPVRAFLCGDPPEKFHHGIWFDPAMLKFVPERRLRTRVRAKMPDGTFSPTAFAVKDCPAVFGYRRDSTWDPEHFFTRQQATWGRGDAQAKAEDKPHILFTFFIGLRMMYYLGCRRVYLLGVDFEMTADRGYSFDQERWPGAIACNNNSYRLAGPMCEELLPIFQRVGYEVYNCNRQSALRAFPFVPFDEAVEDCRGLVPKEPLDLQGWYEKIEDQNREDNSKKTLQTAKSTIVDTAPEAAGGP